MAQPTNEPDPLPEGYNLGRYVIDCELAPAGMGRVYRALDTNLKEVVAVNVLSPALRGEQGRSKFLLAFRRAFKKHRGLVRSYGLVKGIPFAVVACCDGEAAAVDVSRE